MRLIKLVVFIRLSYFLKQKRELLSLFLISLGFFLLGQAFVNGALVTEHFPKTYLLLLLPTLSKLVPPLRLKQSYFPDYLPVKKWLKVIIGIIDNFTSKETFLLISFLLGVGTSSNISYLAGMVFFCGLLISELVLNLLTWRKLSPTSIFFICIVGILISFIKQNAEIWVFILLTIALLGSIYQTCPLQTKSLSFAPKQREKQGKVIFTLWILFIKNRTVATTLLIAFIFKSFFLYLYSSFNTDRFVISVCFAPFAIFTYVFTNTFGFFEKVFSCVYRYNGNFRTFFIYYLKLLFPILVVDFLLASIYVLIDRRFILQLSLMYFSTTLFCVPTAFLASVFGYRKVLAPSIKSLNTNTSFKYNLICLLPITFMLHSIQVSIWASLLSSLVIIVLILIKQNSLNEKLATLPL